MEHHLASPPVRDVGGPFSAILLMGAGYFFFAIVLVFFVASMLGLTF